MWLERFGTVNQNIFFGFCAVIFVILILVIICLIVKVCSRNISPLLPGYSLTSTFVISTLFVCVSILFRGIQPQWGTNDAMVNVCQLFVPFITLGYVMFGASLFIKMWMMVIFYRFFKNTIEWVGNFILWILVVLVGAAIIIWEATFTPNVFAVNSTQTLNDSWHTLDDATDYIDDVVTMSGVTVYECRGWSADGSRDNEQFAWRVSMSCLMAFILLMSLATLPFYCSLTLHPEKAKPAARAALAAAAITSVNATFCVIAGLIVWFQYKPAGDLRVNDSNKYAIIGSLQLWMLFVGVIATLVAEVIAMRTGDVSAAGGTRVVRKHSSSRMANTSFMPADKRMDKNDRNSKPDHKPVVENGGVESRQHDDRRHHKTNKDDDDSYGDESIRKNRNSGESVQQSWQTSSSAADTIQASGRVIGGDDHRDEDVHRSTSDVTYRRTNSDGSRNVNGERESSTFEGSQASLMRRHDRHDEEEPDYDDDNNATATVNDVHAVETTTAADTTYGYGDDGNFDYAF